MKPGEIKVAAADNIRANANLDLNIIDQDFQFVTIDAISNNNNYVKEFRLIFNQWVN